MQLQLIIGAIVALIIAGLVTTAAIYRANAIDAEAKLEAKKVELAEAVRVNESNLRTINRMKEVKEKDDHLVADLQKELGDISDKADQLTRDIANLERANHDVQVYLGTGIPGDLARLLNNGTAASAANRVRRKPAAKSSDRAVPQAAH